MITSFRFIVDSDFRNFASSALREISALSTVSNCQILPRPGAVAVISNLGPDQSGARQDRTTPGGDPYTSDGIHRHDSNDSISTSPSVPTDLRPRYRTECWRTVKKTDFFELVVIRGNPRIRIVIYPWELPVSGRNSGSGNAKLRNNRLSTVEDDLIPVVP